MKEHVKIFFSPQHPLIWFAEYHPDIKEIKVPLCKLCHELIQVQNYDNVICQSCNENTFYNDEHVEWSVENGAKVIPIDHFILEFDENGQETINYKYLPHDGLLRFGLLDPSTFVSYGIELFSGRITIGDFTSGQQPFYIATGINTQSTPSFLVKVSDYITSGQAKMNLHYSKKAILKGDIQVSVINFETIANFNMDPKNFIIDNIAIGYTCEIPDWEFEVMIRIDCNNHLPYFTTNAKSKKKEIN